MNRCSRGRSNWALARATRPGSSIRFTLASWSDKPWITARPVATHVSLEPTGDTDLVRRKDPDASHHTGLIVPRSGLDHTGLVKSLSRQSVTWQGCRRQGNNVPAKNSAWLTPQEFAAIVMKAPEASSSLCPIRAAALPGSLIAWNIRKEQL